MTTRTALSAASIALVLLFAACGGTGSTPDEGTEGDAGSGGEGGSDPAGQGGAAGEGPGAGGAAGSGPQAGEGGQAGGSQGGSSASCGPNTADCNGDANDGCETHLDVDISNCGACGTPCPSFPHQPGTCVGGACKATCDGGFADCDGKPATGCETAVVSDVSNCGTCGKVCPSAGGATPVCAAGVCTLKCPAPSADCNQTAGDGCETNLQTDAANCGVCGFDCQGASCVKGQCMCAGETIKAEKLLLDLYVMMDQSGSMLEKAANGQTKWDATKQALTAFLNDPASGTIGVGIQYFPLPGPGTTDSCDTTLYATPEVEIAPLPGVASAIVTSLGKHTPDNNTPTSAALTGAIDHAKAFSKSHPGHRAVVVLTTDGDPTKCSPTDIPSIAQIAADGYSSTPSTPTFVIGVGTSTASLNEIAKSGGTSAAFIVDTGKDVVAQMQAAFVEIQKAAIACSFAIPKPKMGAIDYKLVNVVYTPGNGAPPEIVGNVANALFCNPIKGGWYYDNPFLPQQIVLCPASCKKISSDQTGQVSVQLGCATHKG